MEFRKVSHCLRDHAVHDRLVEKPRWSILPADSWVKVN
jgi:hypothetical protein